MESLLKSTTRDNLNKAIGFELYASNLYKNLANQMQSVGYFGAQKYFIKESVDEISHYQILVDYFNDRGDLATVPMVKSPTERAMTLMDAFKASYDAEYELGEFYKKVYEQSEEVDDDCTTSQFLLQFIEIQRKSIGEVKDILAMLKIAGDNTAALLEIDEKLGE